MLMKRQITKTFLFFLLIQTLTLANNSQADSSLFPLSVGNKYFYLSESVYTSYSPYKNELSYSIDSIKIDTSKTYNSILYYKYGNNWITYNNSDSTMHNLPGNSILFEWDLSPLGKVYNREFFGDTNSCYGYVFSTSAGSGSATNNYAFFASNIGIVGSGVNSFTPYAAYRLDKTLIAMISTDSINGFVRQDEAAPIFEATTISRVANTNNIKLSSTIKHKFSYQTDPYHLITKGCSFIKNVEVEYFYKKKFKELPHQFSDLSMDSEINFSCIINLNMELVSNGYILYYKISATDKAFIPHTVCYPETGFAELDLDSLSEYKLDFYPLKTGNYWIYNNYKVKVSPPELTFLSKTTVKVIGDTTLSNGKNYFILLRDSIAQYERIDTLNGILFSAKVINEDVVEKALCYLYADEGSNYLINRPNITGKFTTYYSTTSVFDHPEIPIRKFAMTTDTSYNFSLLKDIGLYTERSLISTGYNNLSVLIYAEIDSVQYGELVSVEDELTTVVDYSLNQNYPNPFNPSTTINYSIPKEGLVKIKVFDILGREVTQLVNSQMQAGTYKVEFNSAGLASGVYIYSLFVDNNLKSSKKMILIK